MTAVKVIVGLGNPGSRYAETRHNAGFWFVEAASAREHAVLRSESKFHGDFVQTGNGCRLLKPDTFMNHSGQAVMALSRFYKFTPEQMLVAHDELDLPPGSARLKRGGGHGGHNGLRDIIQHLGSKNFLRLRLGVGHPGHKSAVVNYVLDKPRKAEYEAINQAIGNSLEVLPLLFAGNIEKAMHQLHSLPTPQPISET